MHARAPALLVAFAAAAVLAAAAPATATHEPAVPPEGFTLTLDPDPVRGGFPFTVHFTADEADLAAGKLKVCYSEDHAATLCLLPVEMRVADVGGLMAGSEPVPPGHEFGVNLTVTLANGTVFDYPGNGAEYVFFTASAAEKAVPGAGSIVVGFGVAASSLLLARRR